MKALLFIFTLLVSFSSMADVQVRSFNQYQQIQVPDADYVQLTADAFSGDYCTESLDSEVLGPLRALEVCLSEGSVCAQNYEVAVWYCGEEVVKSFLENR